MNCDSQPTAFYSLPTIKLALEISMFAGLNAEAYDRAYTDRQLVQRLAKYFIPYRRSFVWLCVLILAISLIQLFSPLAAAQGIDMVTSQPSIDAILLLGLALIVLAVGNWLATLFSRRVSARLIGDIISTLRRDAFAASIGHDLSFFDKYQSGKIISRITNDTQELSNVVNIITQLGSQFGVLIILVVVLLRISVLLTLALLIMSPLVVLMGVMFRRIARQVTRNGFRVTAEVNASVQEAVAGMRVAKNFRQEANNYEAFTRINGQAYDVNVRRGFVLSTVFPAVDALGGIATALLVYMGGIGVSNHVLTVGAWFLFITSVFRFWFPLSNLAAFWAQIQGGFSACERIFALIDAEVTVKQIEDGRRGMEDGKQEMIGSPSVSRLPSPVVLKGEIEFKHVNFRYNEQQKVLDDFSLCIDQGESVAFVGHTGAGKSSIIKLVMRFYEFQAGQILVDGHDIRTVSLPDYRRQIGLVSQSPFLFAGSVLDNIRYAAPQASDADVESIAKRIGDGEWLETLPNGLRTQVGERGGRLSMGQRQLVALARVLAQKPPIFILDEATASVDPFNELQIQNALKLILANSTSILIAHRLSTVQAANRIIAVDHGRIIEVGNHEQLMAKGGYYSELYQTYFRHQIADYKPAP